MPRAHKLITFAVIATIFLVCQIILVVAGDFIEIRAEDSQNLKPIEERMSPALNNLKDKQVVIEWGDKQKSLISPAEFVTKYQRQYLRRESSRINFKKIEEALKAIAPAANQPPIDAKLEFASKGNRLKEFSPSQDGRKLNIEKSVAQIARSLIGGQTNVRLVFDNIPAAISLQSMDGLGITALLGRGESDFKGSSAGRIHNIKTGSAKFHGLLLKPAEEFSFNSILGEVNDKNGYEYELVIKNGKLIPEYGGGLCQVSTTLFRAAVFSGLPILERRGHSLPVRYYNPQGFDATIYPGVTDLRFVNDTPSYILIQTKIENTKLVFEIYGSSDGRKTEVIGPKILDQQPDGSMRTTLTRKITALSGETKEDVFKSNYKSPSLFPLEKNPLE